MFEMYLGVELPILDSWGTRGINNDGNGSTMTFTIPIGNINIEDAENRIREMISNYSHNDI